MCAQKGALGAAIMFGLIGLIPAFGVELVVRGLKRRSATAWKIARGLSTVYLISAFFPLGLFSLLGLTNEETKEEFGLQPPRSEIDQRRRDRQLEADDSGEWEELDLE